jgi:endonuclease G
MKSFQNHFLSIIICFFLFGGAALWAQDQALENTPLYFGNPSGAVSDLQNDQNYLMEKAQFTLSYNNLTHNPNWVAWHLCTEDLGEADRANNFRPDAELPGEWYAVKKADYKFTAYGFDRGHLCPSADRTASPEDNSETFLMTNMVPQAPDNNRIVWVALEKFEREQVLQGREAYIFAGPIGRGGSGDRGYFDSIPLADGQEIQVPAYTWKIILFLADGIDDLSRLVNTPNSATLLAVCVPNQKGCAQNGSWQQYICSVDYIEEITGYDFFSILPDELEDKIESSIISW